MKSLNNSSRLKLQGVNFFQNCLETLFQLFFRPGLGFRPRELRIIRQGAAVKVGGFVEQRELLVVLCGHYSIVLEIGWPHHLKNSGLDPPFTGVQALSQI